MSEGNFAFRNWIMSQKSSLYQTQKVDEDHYLLRTDHSEAEINFYVMDGEEDIVEFRITDNDTEENKFFLHFLNKDEDHSTELYEEMTETLISLKDKRKIKVLLSCSSAMTTTFFAEQLQSASDVLSLDYEFSAVPVSELYEQGFNSDIILLAPQIGYEYDRVKSVLTEQLVLKIPTRLFGSYDAGGCLTFVQEEYQKAETEKKEEEKEELTCGCINDLRALIIAVMPSGKGSVIQYRVYYKGKKEKDGEVIKSKLTFKDITDLLDTETCTRRNGGNKIDTVGILLPGIIRNGIVDLTKSRRFNLDMPVKDVDMVTYLEDEYEMPFDIRNNVNAAALGYYKSQYTYKNIVFHSQPKGFLTGGAGIVINGHLYEGTHSCAGEDRLINPIFTYSGDTKKMVWDPDGMAEIVSKSLLGVIAYLDPEVILVRSELTPDMSKIRQELKKYVPDGFIPELIYIKDFSEYIFLGELELIMNQEKGTHE